MSESTFPSNADVFSKLFPGGFSEPVRKYHVTVRSLSGAYYRDNAVVLEIRAYTAQDALVQVKARPDFLLRHEEILRIEPAIEPE